MIPYFSIRTRPGKKVPDHNTLTFINEQCSVRELDTVPNKYQQRSSRLVESGSQISLTESVFLLFFYRKIYVYRYRTVPVPTVVRYPSVCTAIRSASKVGKNQLKLDCIFNEKLEIPGIEDSRRERRREGRSRPPHTSLRPTSGPGSYRNRSSSPLGQTT
jgi:hypothetical protein